MKHPRTHIFTTTTSRPPSRSVSKHARIEALRTSTPAIHSGEPIDLCYRAVLETSDSAILLLSPESIILGWNQAAEAISGWTADEALGRSYVDLCLSSEARAAFLAGLERVTGGTDVKGLGSPLQTRAGLQTMVSWNISRVLGRRRHLIGLMAIGTAPHTQIEEALRLAQAQARSEARRAQTAAEEERQRIARELHDEFGQALTGLKFDLAWLGIRLAQSLPSSDCTDPLARIQTMTGSVDRLLESVRTTAAALRPAMLDDLGLIPALECLSATFRHRTGTRCEVDVAPELLSMNLPSEISVSLFRIAQESLTNVMRHAAASQVRIRLFRDRGIVTLEVTDNGTGITSERMTAPHSFGLRGMQERVALLGGRFHIVGTSGVGTTACASLPLEDRSAS